MNEETLRELIATLSNKEKSQISAATPIQSLFSESFGHARLAAALRYKLNVSNAEVYHAATFGDLCKVLGVAAQDGAAPTVSPPYMPSVSPLLAQQTSNGGRTMQVGIDLQQIAAVSVVPDYWEDDFYRNTFTPREIAYAILQPSPPATFAGMWCAKEAVRKADSALAHVAWTAIEVIHDASSKPSMAINGEPLAGILSISHSGEVAIAIFIAAGLPEPVPAPVQAQPAYLPENSPEHTSLNEPAATGKPGRWALAIALLALLISAAAFAFAVVHR